MTLCSCVSDMSARPVPPTDMVFALDFHTEDTLQIFERMREIVTVMVNVTKIRNNGFFAGTGHCCLLHVDCPQPGLLLRVLQQE